MKPPTRDEIRTLLTVSARGEGVTIDIDEITVELITRAIESNPLRIAALGEEHSLTIVAVAVQAFMFGVEPEGEDIVLPELPKGDREWSVRPGTEGAT